jgi:hypothetical protein
MFSPGSAWSQTMAHDRPGQPRLFGKVLSPSSMRIGRVGDALQRRARLRDHEGRNAGRAFAVLHGHAIHLRGPAGLTCKKQRSAGTERFVFVATPKKIRAMFSFLRSLIFGHGFSRARLRIGRGRP